MAGKSKTGPRVPVMGPRGPNYATWSRIFLATLAETSNVSAAARAAEITTSTAYETRRTNSDFYRKWQIALCEGYDNLEMELLRRMREGEVKSAVGAKRGVRTYENAVALRLLGAHQDSATRERATRDNQDAGQIIVAINAKLDKMRERRLALNDQTLTDQTPSDQAQNDG
jgi:hypothetical protein